jgi:hypothetical protein
MKNVWKMAGLALAAGLLMACENEQEAVPANAVPHHKPALVQVIPPGGEEAEALKLELGSDIEGFAAGRLGAEQAAELSCPGGNRVEFDVYDQNPEFVNPKDYRILLRQGDKIVARRAFSQYCTANNTVVFKDLPSGEYTYVVSSSCTESLYRGRLSYGGGHQVLYLYIDQALCD